MSSPLRRIDNLIRYIDQISNVQPVVANLCDKGDDPKQQTRKSVQLGLKEVLSFMQMRKLLSKTTNSNDQLTTSQTMSKNETMDVKTSNKTYSKNELKTERTYSKYELKTQLIGKLSKKAPPPHGPIEINFLEMLENAHQNNVSQDEIDKMMATFVKQHFA